MAAQTTLGPIWPNRKRSSKLPIKLGERRKATTTRMIATLMRAPKMKKSWPLRPFACKRLDRQSLLNSLQHSRRTQMMTRIKMLLKIKSKHKSQATRISLVMKLSQKRAWVISFSSRMTRLLRRRRRRLS